MVVVPIDVDIGNLLEVALTDSIDNVYRPGGAGDSILIILIAGGDENRASIGGAGGGERVCAPDERDGSRGPIADVEKQYGRDLLRDDYYLSASATS